MVSLHYPPILSGSHELRLAKVKRSLPRRLRTIAVVVLCAVLVLGLSLLGFWQLDRARQKQAMLSAVELVLQQRRPVALAQVLDRNARDDFAWAEVSGHFVAPLIFLDNQQHQGRAGLRLYAPLAQPGEQTRLLVDLGWLPWADGRVLPHVQLPVAPVVLAGLLAPPPSVGVRMGAAAAIGRTPVLLTRLDPDELSAQGDVHYATRVLRLDPAQTLGYARDLNVLANTLPPERHRGYAVQWFALAAALSSLLLWHRSRTQKS